MRSTLACVAAVALAAGSAHGAFFSFASGTASGAWTFTGQGATFGSGLGSTPVTLLIDDRHGALPTLQVSAEFDAQVSLTHADSISLGGGTYLHTYLANGSFGFLDVAAGTPLLTVEFSNVVFTARGGESSWYTTASLHGDNMGNGSVSMIWSGAHLPGYDLTPGALVDPNFAFGLAALNTSGAIPYNFQDPGAELANWLPSQTWYAEASFTAAAIPAPGAGVALLAAGAFVMRRRRR